MKYLTILLVLLSCTAPTIEEVEEELPLKESCQRLLDNDYDPISYPAESCRCFFVRDGDGWKFSHKWSLKEYEMWQDSIRCGLPAQEYGDLTMTSAGDMIINGQVLTCDCEE